MSKWYETEEWANFVIDFSNCKNDDDLHELLKEKLDFSYFYGKNLDALWDCITGDMYLPTYVTIGGFRHLPKDLRTSVEEIIRIFKRAETMYGDIRLIIEE